MTTDEPGEARRRGGPSPHGRCSCGGRFCGDGADDALLDGIAAGSRAVEATVDDLDEAVERELAELLIEWRRSVRQHPQTWSVDVDRAATLVSRARATAPRRRRLLPGTTATAAVVAGLVVVVLWGTPSPAPQASDEVALATSADLDRAAAALERGDLPEARTALARAGRGLPAGPGDDAARRLEVRYRALREEVAAGSSHRRPTREPGAASGSRTATTGPTARRSPRTPSWQAAPQRSVADGPATARSRTERRSPEERPAQPAPPRDTRTAPTTGTDDPRPGDDDVQDTTEEIWTAPPAPGREATGEDGTDEDGTDEDGTEPSEDDELREHDDDDRDDDRDEDDEDDEDD